MVRRHPESTDPRRGYWWVDGEPDVKVPGVLRREADRWALELIGTLPLPEVGRLGLSATRYTTLHGWSGEQAYTLAQAYFGKGDYRSSQLHDPLPDGSRWQNWWGYELIVGDEVNDETLFDIASFELTALNAWWPASGLQGIDPDFEKYEPPDPLIAHWDGAQIMLTLGVTQSFGNRRSALEESAVFRIAKPDGFTLDWLRTHIILPLQGLLGACFNLEVYSFNEDLHVKGEEEWHGMRHVNPGVVDVAAESSAYSRWPNVTVDRIDFPDFIPNWLDLARKSPVALNSCLKPRGDGPLQSQVINVVNAAETLHRALTPGKPTEVELLQKVAVALTGSEVPRKYHKRIEGFTKHIHEPNLETRLRALGRELGEEFHLWFFNGQLDDFALVAATDRNTLSHGYETRHEVERHIPSLMGVERLTRELIRVRMLCACGLPTGWPLVQMFNGQQRYLGIIHQTLADWESLATLIRDANKAERENTQGRTELS